MSFFTNFFNTIQKDEQWVVTELQKGWAALQKAEATTAMDIEGVFAWIKAHQADLQTIVRTALQGLALAGMIDPQLAPLVPVATAALDASEVAIDSLSKAVVAGSTPLSTAVNAYHAVIDARTAVTSVLKAATSSAVPAAVPAPVAVAPAA